MELLNIQHTLQLWSKISSETRTRDILLRSDCHPLDRSDNTLLSLSDTISLIGWTGFNYFVVYNYSDLNYSVFLEIYINS